MADQSSTILQLDGVSRRYSVKRGIFRGTEVVKANQNISFNVKKGSTIAVIGESGCGKSTLAKQIIGIEHPDEGRILFKGKEIQHYVKRPHELIKAIQLVFQNPYSSLNPRQKVQAILDDPLRIHTDWDYKKRLDRIHWIMDKTGLSQEFGGRYPHMFSGGQRQRIAIARALVLNPELLILDEPVSALDISVRAQVINLLKDIQEEFNLTYVFISHDIALVKFFADDVLVMYMGQVVEHGSAKEVLNSPKHPYTRSLVSSSPTTRPEKAIERIRLTGEIPSFMNPPSGCPFHPRCYRRVDICSQTCPTMTSANSGVSFSCHNPET